MMEVAGSICLLLRNHPLDSYVRHMNHLTMPKKFAFKSQKDILFLKPSTEKLQ